MTGRIPLLLLPGLLNDDALWAAQRTGLADIADCHVGDLTAGTTLHEVAAQVLDAAPPTFALAGFSLGGFVAQQILRMAPERVCRLALLDTTYLPDSSERAAQRAAQAASVRAASGASRTAVFHGFGDAMMRQYVDASRLDDEALLHAIRAMTTRLGADVFLRQIALERVDGSDVLSAWQGPALVLCGANDRITPVAVHEQMHALMPQSRLEVLAACGHLSPMERPEAVNDALRAWLHAPTAG